ncbi:Na(+)-translocating NADH-quinone reductase subunit A [Blastopirellula sp. JC732]|uniref:Na(+)-translocating NADH-quinone reductase subunit A n=1 Tax=Blastopirellula sediminis TaxID=2894196 RepID=A0A9X1MR34_9BACT|nr:Na(+)-translocating NADH-quinone reductase subunit A [Blastopirellula sediminis]MCC9605514.1 Na(+)-translocating NADH-quinone reductase subunit A [Blastopirellula sediminis]MCC9631186.1 Na(+)-translocating NADH-quinone reductase subunit A [Blastopirellula sediminis]
MPRTITLKRGLDLPISGRPQQTIESAGSVSRVALLGDDYIGMRPTMLVTEGDTVKQGQALFEDKKNPGVLFTSPAAGKVVAVNRGPKRRFLSVVVEKEGDAQVEFTSHGDQSLLSLTRQQVADGMVAAGLWPALRQRPYGKTPSPTATPLALFVTAIDTNPLAADPAAVIGPRKAEFTAGLEALSKLTDGPMFVCRAPGADIPGDDLPFAEVVEFSGPHPAGLPGTHIHCLYPAGRDRYVWYIGYQDVLAIGSLFKTGRLDVKRILSLAGPAVSSPRLIETTLGADLTQLTAGQLKAGELRVISGSVFAGRTCADPNTYLGRYHNQISVLVEGNNRDFMGWLTLGFGKFSTKPVFLSALTGGGKSYDFTTCSEGSHRAIIPTGMYEKVMPLDIEPTALLKSLVVNDMESAQALGALELEEEDLALCTYVDTGKHDFGSALRKNLTRIEAEG